MVVLGNPRTQCSWPSSVCSGWETGRDTGFGCVASCVPSPLCDSFFFCALVLLMSGWQEVVTRRMRKNERRAIGQQVMRLPEWQCAACSTQSFLNKHSCRQAMWEGQGPQQRSVHQRRGSGGTMTELRPRQPSISTPGSTVGCADAGPQRIGDGASKASECHSGGPPRKLHHDFARAGEAGGGGNEESSTAGTDGPGKSSLQKGPRGRREGFGESRQSPEYFCCSTGGGLTGPDRPREPDAGILHASIGTSTGKRKPFQTLDALTGAVESLWIPEAGQPPEHLVRLIQESRAVMQASSVLSTREG